LARIRHARGFDIERARRELARADPVLAGWMRRIGPLAFDWHRPFDTVDALARAILHQQLSGKAAATIEARLRAAVPGGPRITAAGLLAIEAEAMRACGVSSNKRLALLDLAERAVAGEVPSSRALAWMDDEQTIATLTRVRGIGRWTVEMLLMFRLGRPDVLPVDDLGIRKGAQRLLALDRMPGPRELRAHGERWAPWRSLAAFYLWRIAASSFDDAQAGWPSRLGNFPLRPASTRHALRR
jgi:DNA-3-methyladenine glycosylase II